jgi:hypothetical protein
MEHMVVMKVLRLLMCENVKNHLTFANELLADLTLRFVNTNTINYSLVLIEKLYNWMRNYTSKQ